MGDSERGTINRITIDIAYPDGTAKQRIIRGDELARLAMVVVKPSAVRDHLPNLADQAGALAEFDRGDGAGDDIKPAMMTVYDDGTYSVECRPSDHRPPASE